MAKVTPKDFERILQRLKFKYIGYDRNGEYDTWESRSKSLTSQIEVQIAKTGRWEILWEEVRAMGFGLQHFTRNVLKFVTQGRRTNEGELEELTGTGGIAGFGTPYAFATKEPVSSKRKKKMNEMFESLLVEFRGVTPQQYRQFLKKHGLKMTKANVDVSTSTSHVVGDLWVQEPTNIEVVVSHLGNWKVSWHRDSKYGSGLQNLKSALSKYMSIRDSVNEGSSTPVDMEKVLLKAKFRKAAGGAYSDTWRRGNKKVEINMYNKWTLSVNGKPKQSAPMSNNPKTVSALASALNEIDYGSGGLEVVKGGKVIDQLDLPAVGQYAHYKGKRYEYQRSKKTRGGYFIDLDKPLNEGGDPYYGWRNDESQTPRQKIGKAISEINKQLAEVEKVVKRTQRLKKETGTSNNALWNRTNKSLMKIESRMHKISQTIRNMRG